MNQLAEENRRLLAVPRYEFFRIGAALAVSYHRGWPDHTKRPTSSQLLVDSHRRLDQTVEL